METVGIITYHSAYNFGSALQAFATQSVIEQCGYGAEIVNYRMKSQRAHYRIIRVTGPRAFINDLGMLSLYNQKVLRQERFEKFFSLFLNMGEEFQNPEDFTRHTSFSTIVSGSDQIWNKHSNELKHVDWKFMNPYLLKDFEGKRVSYASSIADMQGEELNHLKNELIRFESISMRESSGADKIGKLLHRRVATVLDPTLLLTRCDWDIRLSLNDLNNAKRYVLFYSLADRCVIEKYKSILEVYETSGFDVKYITPYAKVPFMEKFQNCLDFGPIEFLTALKNADVVITDSYHGTLFSINFHKDFYSINGLYSSDIRKTEILQQLGLQNRISSWQSGFNDLDKEEINYARVDEILKLKREESIQYLKKALDS